MELYRNAPPAAIGIPTKLLPQDPEAAGTSTYPYCAAAQELGLLVLESCPQKKLECIGEGRSLQGGKGDVRTGSCLRGWPGTVCLVSQLQVLLPSNGGVGVPWDISGAGESDGLGRDGPLTGWGL